MEMNAPAVSVTRYGTRYWAVWLNGELLAVTLYRKGARAVFSAITKMAAHETGEDKQTGGGS